MKTVTAITRARAAGAEGSPRGMRRGLWWWLPVALAGVYAAALIPELPAIIAHTWWSADSGSAGVVAQLYSHPAPGQYIILGDHGWYEAFSFYLLTRGLPAHRFLWYAAPLVCLGDHDRPGRGIRSQSVRALRRRPGDRRPAVPGPGRPDARLPADRPHERGVSRGRARGGGRAGCCRGSGRCH